MGNNSVFRHLLYRCGGGRIYFLQVVYKKIGVNFSNIKDMKKIPPMFGDDIDREWIYMLEDKLYYPHGRDEKMIRHCDFQEVVEEWTKLKKLYEYYTTKGNLPKVRKTNSSR